MCLTPPGATICVQPGTTTELNLSDHFRKNKLTFKTVVIESEDEIESAFLAGRCDARFAARELGASLCVALVWPAFDEVPSRLTMIGGGIALAAVLLDLPASRALPSHRRGNPTHFTQ